MGAWSHEPFGNDTACDWAYGLDSTKDIGYLEQAIDAVLGSGDPVGAREAEKAIAAVEVLAKMLGKGTQADGYTESADIWVAAANALPSAALRAKAIKALDLITAGESELAQLWNDTDTSDAWEAAVAQLRAAMAD